MSWFYETWSHLSGTWSPRKSADEPDPRGEHITERSFRPLRTKAVEISPDHERLTLEQLQAVYAPDGHLRATQ